MESIFSLASSSLGLMIEGLLCLFIYDRIYRWYCKKHNRPVVPIFTHQIPKAEMVAEDVSDLEIPELEIPTPALRKAA